MFFTPQEFGLIAQGMGCFVLGSALVTGIAFTQGWGWRFRAVGVTAFAVVLTIGLFALSLAPITPTTVAGAVRYKVVYDRNAAEAVISVSPDITPSQLAATLQQASANLFSLGRNGIGKTNLTIRARTLIHPQPDASQLVYLGQVTRSLRQRDDPNQRITIDPQAFAVLTNYAH
ncbi:MAG: Ycf51 family protein [Pseudanabaenaceae cyanobacterium]